MAHLSREALRLSVSLSACLLLLWLPCINGHGRLVEPPSRSSMWRYGFSNPPNNNDDGLNCGGFDNQWERNEGKCGVCGDPYEGPRKHEAGGKYANGIVTRRYLEGATIEVMVQITNPHGGWYEFRLCENEDPKVPITHACLDKHLLEIEGNGTRYFFNAAVPTWSYLQVKLPSGVTCANCVLQWKWNSGNRWGTDPDGTSGIGRGNQEQYYGCADIEIQPRNETRTTDPTVSDCRSLGWFQSVHGDAWCKASCVVGFCPTTHCVCGPAEDAGKCRPVGRFKRLPGSDVWCRNICSMGYCPKSRCTCPPS